MKKISLSVLSLCALILLSLTPVHALHEENMTHSETEQIEVYINGDHEPLQQTPVFIEGELYVPMKEIYEAFDAAVRWHQEDHSVSASFAQGELIVDLETLAIRMETNAGLDESAETLLWPMTAQILNGRVMVPLQVVGESLDIQAEFSEQLGYILFDTETEIAPITTVQEKGLTADPYIIADFLSFLIQESTEDKLQVSADTYQMLVQHSETLFVEDKQDAALEEQAEEISVYDWMNGSDPADRIVKTGALLVSRVEVKQVAGDMKLSVIEGTFQDEDQSKGIIYYFGEADAAEQMLIDLICLKVGEFTADEETDSRSAASENKVIVAVAGALLPETNEDSQNRQP